MTKKWILAISLLLTFSFKGEETYTINPADYIYGQWQCKRHEWWKFSKFTEKQVAQIKASTLHIEKDRIYFEGIDFVDSCIFTNEDIKIKKLTVLDEDDLSITYDSTGPLRYEYTQREFQELYRIELGPPYELALLYLDQDTLIVNYCGGVTFFMEKLPHIKQVYRGKGKAEHTMTVPEHSSFLQLRYKLEHVQAWLTIKDQAGQLLCDTKTGANLEAKTIKLPLSQVNELTFKIDTANPHTKWQLDAAIY